MTLLDDAAVPYQVVLTKVDKITQPAMTATVAETEAVLKRHPAAYPAVRTTSARSGLGIAELRAELAKLAAPESLR